MWTREQFTEIIWFPQNTGPEDVTCIVHSTHSELLILNSPRWVATSLPLPGSFCYNVSTSKQTAWGNIPGLHEFPKEEWPDWAREGHTAKWVSPGLDDILTPTAVAFKEVTSPCLTCRFILCITRDFFSWPDFIITLLSKHHIWKFGGFYSTAAPENRDVLLRIQQMSNSCL